MICPILLAVTLLAPRAILLDLDGTLIDTLDEFEGALAAMLAQLDLPAPDRTHIAHTIGKGSEHLIRSVLARALQQAGRAGQANSDAATAALTAALFERAMALYITAYEAQHHRLAKLYPGVREGLAALADKGYPMAVVTNKPVGLAKPLLTAMGLAQHVAFLYGGDSFAQRKPHPLPLLKACERLGCAPAQALMVGDSRNDAAAAHAAGCPVVLLRYGFNHGEPIEQVPANGYFDSIAAIAAQLPTRPA